MGTVVTNSPKWEIWYQIPQMGEMGRANPPLRRIADSRKESLSPVMARTFAANAASATSCPALLTPLGSAGASRRSPATAGRALVEAVLRLAPPAAEGYPPHDFDKCGH